MTECKVTSQELADVLGLTVRRVNQLAEDNVIRRCSINLFDLAPACKAYIAQFGNHDNDLTEWRRRLVAAQAQTAEQELATATGSLVELAAVEATWSTANQQLRDNLLALHSTVCGKYPDMRPEIVELIKTAVRQILSDHATASTYKP